MIAWALDNELEVIDLGRDADVITKTVVDAGLRVGSADLTVWTEMMSPDAGARREAVARNADFIRDCAAAGRQDFLHLHDSRRPVPRPRREFRLHG